MTLLTPEFLQSSAGSYAASRLRFQQEDFTPVGEGALGQPDLRVSQRGAGANMSVDVAAGSGVVRGDSITRQGLYHIVNDATINAAIGANASGNPRIDRVVLSLNDSVDSGSGSDTSAITVIAGTPTAAASLDNLNGAAAIPNNALHLADVVVANAAASILDANIRSRRSFAKPIIPPLVGLTDTDQTPLVPQHLAPTSLAQTAPTVTNVQLAYLAYLPRRVVGATKLRWRYGTTSPAATGNYIFGIYDASGRQVAATTSTAYNAGTNITVPRSEALTATTNFEAGMYYVLYGNTIAGQSIFFQGVPMYNTVTEASPMAAAVPGTLLRSATGGVTLPASGTILGFTDIGSSAAYVSNVGAAPLVSLSTT